MKRIFVPLLIIMLSCGKGDPASTKPSIEALIASKDIQGLKAKQQMLSEQMRTTQDGLTQIEEALKYLDTSSYGLPLVRLYKAKDTLFRHYVEVQGKVDTDYDVLLSAESYGKVKKIYYKVGDYVEKGQTVIRIDDNGLRAQMKQMESQRNLARTVFERQKKLWEQHIGSEIQFLEAESNYQSSQKAWEQVKKQIDNTLIKAPFSGYLDDIMIDPGAFVNLGTPLARIVSLKGMEVEAFLPDVYLRKIKKGNSVNLAFPTIHQNVSSKVRYVSNFINPDNSSFTVFVPVPEGVEGIRPNLSAKMIINDYTNEKAIIVPQDIVLEDATGRFYVFTVDDKKNNKGRAKKIFVELGLSQGDLIEVMGIPAGTPLISEGAKNVKEGQKVIIINGSE